MIESQLKLYPYCAVEQGLHSKDTILIVLLWFVHCSSFFQYFLLIYYVCPYSNWKFLIFSILVIYTKLNSLYRMAI